MDCSTAPGAIARRGGTAERAVPGGRTGRLARLAPLFHGALLVVALAVSFSTPATGQTPSEVTLVSNLGQEAGITATSVASNAYPALGFSVDSTRDYVLTSITIDFSRVTASAGSAWITINAGGTNPGAVLYTSASLDVFAAGEKTFSFPENSVLSAGTSYYAVLRATGQGVREVKMTTSNSEDSESLSGWRLDNDLLQYSEFLNRWSTVQSAVKMKLVGRQGPTRVTATMEAHDSAIDEQAVEHIRFDLMTSEPVFIPYQDMRDHALDVTNGRVTFVERVTQEIREHEGTQLPFSGHWRITVRPEAGGFPVAVALEPKPCSSRGAICTADGGRLVAGVSLDLGTASALHSVSIADATETDGELVFKLTLNRATTLPVLLVVEPAGGTATDEDYYPLKDEYPQILDPGVTDRKVTVHLKPAGGAGGR